MKKAFICSAYRGDTEKNAERTRRYCLAALDHGYAPFAPHLLYPQFLRNESGTDRVIGIQCGLEFLKCCDIMLVFGAVTAGMHVEIKEAERLRMEIKYIGEIKDEMLYICDLRLNAGCNKTKEDDIFSGGRT
jgi:hypothetical protein